MSTPAGLPTRAEAIESGLHFYGEVNDSFLRDGMNGPPISKEPYGVSIDIISTEDGSTIDSTGVEKRYFHFKRSYERSIRKEKKRVAKYIASLNAISRDGIVTTTSS
jgi:hypothetical protein